MKKIVVRILIALVVVVLLAALAVRLFLDGAIKRGVETIGPKLTKTDVKLDAVSLSLLSGSGKIKGLLVGNPEGFKAPSAISVGTASLALKPGSLLSDKIVVQSINVESPEVTFETELHANNLKKILANLEESTGGGEKEKPKEKEAKPGKKLQVDDFLISAGKVHVRVTTPVGSKEATVPLPEIHFTDLGQGPEGITAAELSKKVLKEILEKASEAAAKEATKLASDLSKGASDLSKSLATNAVEKATKSIGDLFKKKP